MELNELFFRDEYDGEAIPDGIEITGIANDGRRIEAGNLFVCHSGRRFDSHVLLPALAESGCAAAVVSRDYRGETGGLPVVRVADTRRAEAFAASRFYGSPGDRLTLIGVTGTNGKTSVSTMLRRILCDAGFACALIGTTGYRGSDRNESRFDGFRVGDAATMTTPPPLTLYPLLSAMLAEGVTHVVMEVSSQALVQARVAPLSFSVSVFTNLSPEHLDFHKTMTAYLSAKRILFEKTETAVVNGDSPWSDLLLDGLSCRRVVCGSYPPCGFCASDVEFMGTEGVSYRLSVGEKSRRVFVPIPGSFTVQNSLLSLAASNSLGVGVERAVESLSHMPTVAGRMEIVDTGGFPFRVLIDYAHTEAALRSLLLSVRAFLKPGERLVLLFGCGGDRDAGKRSEMGKTAEEYADFTIVTSDNSRTEDPKKIILAILSGMKKREKRRVIVNRERAIRYAIGSALPGDLILLVGKGHEKYEIDSNGAHEFDEKKIVLSALKERRTGHTTEEDEIADRNGFPD